MNRLQVWTVDEFGRQEMIGTLFVNEESGERDYIPIIQTLPDGTFRADHEEVISPTRH